MRPNRARGKSYVHELPQIDSFDLLRFGVERFNGLVFPFRGSQIVTTSTPCHFGGARPWFVCPFCGKNTRRLYLGRDKVACRKCHNLAYPSQNETGACRSLRKLRAIWNRLGWSMPGWGTRPKGMHATTYQRLSKTYEELEWLALHFCE